MELPLVERDGLDIFLHRSGFITLLTDFGLQVKIKKTTALVEPPDEYQ